MAESVRTTTTIDEVLRSAVERGDVQGVTLFEYGAAVLPMYVDFEQALYASR